MTEKMNSQPKCPKCGKTFSKKYGLKRHINEVHGKERPFKCEECGEKFKRNTDLNRHINEVHGKERPFKCEECGEKFKRQEHLDGHVVQVHRGEKPHVCPRCKKSFGQKGTLNMHILEVHLGVQPYECLICGERFKRDSTLNRHIDEVHVGKRPYECLECGERFKRDSTLNRHIDEVHVGKRPYECLECEKSFKREATLLGHIHKVHLDQKPYECPECGKRLKSSLNRHIQNVHKGKKPYKCTEPECDEKFKFRTQLDRHLSKVHGIANPHICPMCGDAFKNPQLLRAHQITHSDERPYECECGLTFKRVDHLYHHLRTSLIHRQDKQFKCKICKQTFTTKGALTVHLNMNACWYSQQIAQRWEKICEEIAKILFIGYQLRFQQNIPTPEFPEMIYIRPDITATLHNKTIFIDAKRSIRGITYKDLETYPLFGDKIIFWCLFAKKDLFEDDPIFTVVSSDKLIQQLESHKTTKNAQKIDALIRKIYLLKAGIDPERQQTLDNQFSAA